MEMRRILDVDELDRTALEYFQQRLAAAKAVLDGLNVRERQEVDVEVTKIKEKRYDEAVQKEFIAGTVHRSMADFDETLD